MPSNTPNFNFEYPLSSDPLADGAQSIQDFATTADTTFADLLGGTSGQYLAKNSNTNMDFVWSTLPTPTPVFAPRGGASQYFSNRMNMQYDAIGSVATPSATGNPAYFFPVWIPEDCTLDRVGINVPTTAVAGSTVQIALYSPNSSYVPTTRLLDAGSVSTATTGVKELTISQAVSAGLVFVALRWSATGIGLTGYTQTLGGATVATDILVPPSTASAQTPAYGGGIVWRATSTSPFPSTVTPTLSTTAQQFNVFVRRA